MASKKNGDMQRNVVDVHGIYITSEVQGELKVFSIGNLLAVLTTSLVLVTSVSLLVDTIMTSLMRDAAKYTVLKYQPSEDFTSASRAEEKAKELKRRATKHEHIMHEWLLDEQNMPKGPDLLLVMLKIHERLTHLDAIDDDFLHINANQDDNHAQTHLRRGETQHKLKVLGMRPSTNEPEAQQPLIGSPRVSPREGSA